MAQALGHCLLIDGDAGERSKVHGLMANLGFDCAEMKGADEGVRYCQDHQPDVVVMNATHLHAARDLLRLTRYNGKASGRPVVILYADRPDIDQLGESILDGAADFLVKPFNQDLLKFKLKQAGLL
jgi:two-component system, chemotaxis family, chemotaxis protein CheY